MAKRIMILATDGFEQSELEKPKQDLEDAGFETVVVAPHEGEIRGWQHTDWGTPVKVDMTLDKASEAGFDALVLPGGVMNPDKLRMEEKAVMLVKRFCAAGKTVAAICHGPWLLAEAEVIDGKTVTSWPSIRTDLKHAGANVVDEEYVEDGNLITSRKPDDIPAFSQAVIRALEQQEVKQPA
jgi:protease I